MTEAIITNPKEVVQLPHLTFISHLTISGLSPNCDDWQWMKDIHNLQFFDLEIADSKVGSTDDASESSKLLVREQKATFLIRDLGTTELFCQVLEYLPTYLRDEVSSI